MKHSSLLVLTLISSVLMGETSLETTAMQNGEKASTALIQKLGGELKAIMQKEGPVAAVNFCSQNALSLTHEVSKAQGFKIKRTTLQQRNPANRPNSDETKILESWSANLSKGEQPAPLIVATSETHYTYYKPLLINNEVCLKCHGTLDQASPLAQAIKTAYPQDKATGYKMGDLRGMISVEIPVGH